MTDLDYINFLVPNTCPDPEMDHNEMIDILTQAGYIIHKSNPNA